LIYFSNTRDKYDQSRCEIVYYDVSNDKCVFVHF